MANIHSPSIGTVGVAQNPLGQLGVLGQAVWLDFIDRDFLAAGGLQELVDQDGLTGVTSNPSIFAAAIGKGGTYDAQLASLVTAGETSAERLFEALAITDIRAACDTLRPVYDRLNGKDGYVSMEVSPHLALETEATLRAAKQLWASVDRANLMVKIPGTPAGVPAIKGALSAGVSVNVTLLFSVDAYKAVLEAYVSALEDRVTKGEPVDRIASVASLFVSRIDAVMDAKIDDLGTDEALSLRGKIAIANCRRAYCHYLEVINSPRWQVLADKGAMPQRLLWASTAAKDPTYSDVFYVEALIYPNTVNTMPPVTMAAFRDHGLAHGNSVDDSADAEHVLLTAERLGLDLNGVTTQLVDSGIKQFTNANDAIYGEINAKI